MTSTAHKIINEALSLPADSRMSLVERLLVSLNLPVQADIDRLWAKEAERRVSQIDRREVKLVPGEDVFRKIRKKYGR